METAFFSKMTKHEFLSFWNIELGKQELYFLENCSRYLVLTENINILGVHAHLVEIILLTVYILACWTASDVFLPFHASLWFHYMVSTTFIGRKHRCIVNSIGYKNACFPEQGSVSGVENPCAEVERLFLAWRVPRTRLDSLSIKENWCFTWWLCTEGAASWMTDGIATWIHQMIGFAKTGSQT